MSKKRHSDTRRRKTHQSKKRIEERNRSISIILLCALFVAVLGLLGMFLFRTAKKREAARLAEIQSTATSEDWEGAPPIDVELLTQNPYSRPGIPISEINGIVIHYTANPGSTAIANRNYFESLKDTQDNKVSSHFVIGLDGEIVQCIPSSEISYASNSRNSDTLSIECCHPDETGQFTQATYRSVVELTAWLCKRFDIRIENVIRHYDVTGKNCPKYYVEHADAWLQMKADIQTQIDELKAQYP
ncbi:MAG: peptidoglycan recognition family protein [Eubacteriales bacterium]|nr:peptidoglycan recognition family protein [Eubacteriales bacterium]